METSDFRCFRTVVWDTEGEEEEETPIFTYVCISYTVVVCLNVNAVSVWVLNRALLHPGGVTLGARGAPHNTLAAAWLLLDLAPLALWEPDRRIPFTP